MTANVDAARRAAGGGARLKDSPTFRNLVRRVWRLEPRLTGKLPLEVASDHKALTHRLDHLPKPTSR